MKFFNFIDSGEILNKHQVPLCRNKPKWVPANEVKGEGIFIQFKKSKLHQWEKDTQLKTYENQAIQAHNSWCKLPSLDPEQVRFPGVRYILLHSFAHALMRKMAIECGYNAASLKERIYSKRPEEEGETMAGVLIYTAAPDSSRYFRGIGKFRRTLNLGTSYRPSFRTNGFMCFRPLMCRTYTLSR